MSVWPGRKSTICSDTLPCKELKLEIGLFELSLPDPSKTSTLSDGVWNVLFGHKTDQDRLVVSPGRSGTDSKSTADGKITTDATLSDKHLKSKAFLFRGLSSLYKYQRKHSFPSAEPYICRGLTNILHHIHLSYIPRLLDLGPNSITSPPSPWPSPRPSHAITCPSRPSRGASSRSGCAARSTPSSTLQGDHATWARRASSSPTSSAPPRT